MAAVSHNQDALADKFDVKELSGAAQADANERNSTVWEAWRTHKKAVLWSMALSGALIMEGYDVTVVGSFYGHPAFLRRFGVPTTGNDIGYAIPAPWQSGLSNGASAGGIIGLFINGWAADRYGPKIVMGASTIMLTLTIFLLVFGDSLGMLVAGQVLCGIPWGVFQTLTVGYAAEVCPIQLRGYLTAYVNMCWGIGILLSSGIVKATLVIPTDLSWRLPFVLQWIWVIPLFSIVYFCPPSPWWMVRKGRHDDAAAAVRRLTNPKYFSEEDVQNSVAMMIHTTEMEAQNQHGTSYLQCFRGFDLRRSEIAMMAFTMQILSGQSLCGQGIQFLQQAGISTDLSFSLNMVLNSMFIIGTATSWVLMGFFGRRTLYTSGMACMCITLMTIGGLAFYPSNEVKMAMGSLLIILNFIYNCTIGPATYTIIGEISSTRLRQKTIVLARASYKAINIVAGILNPRMLSPLAWNLGPKTGLVWGSTAFLSLIYCLLRLPEAKGRSYGELDILFENRIPAWKFKTTKADQFGMVRRGEAVEEDGKLAQEVAHVEGDRK
ncbi:maltose permease [Dioszegia hungarica]|uniref:Maltose permease n=1 Tax=Dioszegia hungarica TaxID=4972 RepID=A0AA38HGA8_9TREE|nr:maltose permease [Dioszegia hungarica]KAI9638801.1 maltose permease [Dioszegia hungarica]